MDLTDGHCGDVPYPEQVLATEKPKVANLDTVERIRIAKARGKEVDFSCESDEFPTEDPRSYALAHDPSATATAESLCVVDSRAGCCQWLRLPLAMPLATVC